MNIKYVFYFFYLLLLITNLGIVISTFFLIKNKKMSKKKLRGRLLIIILFIVIAKIIDILAITGYSIEAIHDSEDNLIILRPDIYYVKATGQILNIITIIGYVINYIIYKISKKNEDE